MRRILLIDDDQTTQVIVKKALEKDFELISCLNLTAAHEYLRSRDLPSLVLLDRLLPDGDGISFCSQIRQEERLKHLPVIFLSGQDSEGDKVVGFFAGGDDYVTKPFGILELKARIQARLRQSPQTLTLANIHVDIDSQRVFCTSSEGLQREIELTRIEYRILVSFLQMPERVLSRNSLLDKVWGANCSMSDRVVDTHVSHLRKKLLSTDLQVEALRGEGYRLLVRGRHSQAA